MNWFTRLFGTAVKKSDPKKVNIPSSNPVNPPAPEKPSTLPNSNPVQQPDCIGIRFDIGKIDSGGYGEECWKVFWRAIDIKMVAGTQLLEGDTNDTPDRENVYCLAIKWLPGCGRGDDLRKALEQSRAYREVASNPNFISTIQVRREPLVDAGRVDRSGRIAGTSYRALPAFETVMKERSQNQS